jgi:hypothetical protein
MQKTYTYKYSFDAEAKKIRKHLLSKKPALRAKRRDEILEHVTVRGAKGLQLAELLYAKKLSKHRVSISKKFL